MEGTPRVLDKTKGGPWRWGLVAGRVPDGMQFAGDSLRLTLTTPVLGRPRTVQTTSFTVEARDQSGNTTRKAFSLAIDPPRPLVITTLRVGGGGCVGVRGVCRRSGQEEPVT